MSGAGVQMRRTRTARLTWVDTAKAFSILLVVLAHTRIELAFIGVGAVWADWAVEFFGSMRMPLFFAAAGLFATKWLRVSWRELIAGKVALLLWVFLIWQPAVFAYKVAEMVILPRQPENSLLGQLGKMALSPLRPNGELWFLWALCLFFIVAKGLSRLRKWAQVAAPAIVSFGWFAVGERVVPESVLRLMGDGWTGALRYYFFFAAAAVLSRELLRWISALPVWACAALVAGWAGSVLGLAALGVSIPGLRFVISCLAVIAGFGLARLLAWAKPLAYLGRNTLAVYVAHTAIIVAIVCTVHITGLAKVAQAWPDASVLAVFAVAMMMSLALHSVLAQTRYGRYMYGQPSAFMRARSVAAS